ncbi:MAG: RNA polymerase Rpb4 family protein [Candidatus Methanoliparum thermophilum]|uniref:DNA-directed RNA polymerase subunit Rpo4 n=1 Tax=Methanoliparum thermophilum TaxID=2491083 RepID=A0A520KS62_METT2|nr:RNA polymerase Rpb4 family protein [Candidatus Methanoliparum sp. LAM-1]RZN64624.1 MAG: RNA polymerase Rpb4 family protein [Candidatus Methanoliparum thermophilum]BDC35752.1 DNA-directed RNA polymerase subunit F [Candidatus Methanoliparum sp. LAM-1]
MVKVKKIIEEEFISNADAKELLDKFLDVSEDNKMFYEQRRAVYHITKFNKLSADEARRLIEELLSLDKINKTIAIIIANILPSTRGELRSIYAKERYNLSDKEFDEILDIVARYR